MAMKPEVLNEWVTLYEGDCLDVMPTLTGVDAVVTDPPYDLAESNIEYEFAGVSERVTPTKVMGNHWGYSLNWMDAATRLEPRHWIVFSHFTMLGEIQNRIGKAAAVFVWRKPNAPNPVRPVPRMDCEFIVWVKGEGATNGTMREFRSLVIDCPMPQAGCMANERILKPGSGQAAHPCQKPMAVVRPFVKRIEVDTILDPFAGSGTTGIAAMHEGRKCILIERDPAYCDIIRKRISEADICKPGSLFAGSRDLFAEMDAV